MQPFVAVGSLNVHKKICFFCFFNVFLIPKKKSSPGIREFDTGK